MNSKTNKAAKATADALARVLADSHMLYMKAHNFHWNVEGPHFFALHEMFEAQYTDIAGAMDEIAERIRALGEYAPGSSAEFAALARVTEVEGRLAAADMVRETAADYDIIGETIAGAIAVAEEHGDDISAGMLADRLAFHQKQGWMMKAWLK
ncbi:Dps family protein [Sinisalibacter aestuarii]|uniref:DNA starvation/stationary phase protection protein n=1 Tax=Sinisalibacter aestuarii TaxID=2949426 RepID=A0ABQ5LV28_9RHOB|nr:DNA starvation/stationary phase protection protein [Sinisalibacter aestuarii]GKY88844.1 DNA starvation/stationary phase protection protein [Sinisalibacter aestuarii]